MEQFSLEKYLENPNRKITTRYGDREVRIICTDRKDKRPIVALMVAMDDGSEYITSHSINGWIDDEEKYPDKRDLFFADEENTELTEFEKTMIQFSHERNSLILFKHHAEEINAHLYLYYKKLLDLARKELEENYYTKVLDDGMVFKSKLHATDLQTAYDIGKQDALKDLPKWKKATEHKDLEKHVAILEEGKVLLSNYLEEGDYYIKLEDLKNLPKEE